MANGIDVDAAEYREGVRRQLKEAMVARDCEDVELLRTAVEAAREVDLEPEDVDPARALLAKMESQTMPLAFAHIPRVDMEMLQASTSREQAVDILMRCMRVSLDAGFQSEILAEFHYHNFMFCQRNRLRAETASTFLSIMQVLHSNTIVKDRLPEERARELFEALVHRHSRQLPPYSVGAFSPEEALAIREFVARGFFRHYKMYAFAYAHRQELEVVTVDDSAAPKVPSVAALHKDFELDPREVPELQDLFIDPEAATRVDDDAAATASSAARLGIGGSGIYGELPPMGIAGLLQTSSPTFARSGLGGYPAAGEAPPDDRAGDAGNRKAHIEAAIDEALQARLGALDARLAELPG
mmetsp:Transcript_34658/g.91450  ORF Transcript_34658/g.91450 Transcript_34658/m.91450 type:complete len:356 (+) Transcript_34658:85-1152(+)